ncbi:MAG: acyl-CoA dehydrogenase family protein, partial [Bacteroidota bacterium]
MAISSNGTATPSIQKKAREDRFQFHDHYLVEDLLDDDHRMARAAVRDWVKQEVSPIIEEYAEKAECPTHLFKGLAEIGAFGPSLPVEYGGGGM